MLKLVKIMILVATFATLPLNAEDANGQAAGGAPMPDVLWFTDGFPREHPFFVSADDAMLPDGSLNSALLSEGTRGDIQWFVLDITYEVCNGGTISTSSFTSKRPEYKYIAGAADFIVLGKVTGTRPGFWYGKPGTLLRIEPVRWLKSGDSWSERYLFFPVVEMEFGGKAICFQSEYYPVLPELGWQVLVSYNKADKNRLEPVIGVNAAQIIVFPPEGPASLAKYLRKQEPGWVGKTREALLSEFQALIEVTP